MKRHRWQKPRRSVKLRWQAAELMEAYELTGMVVTVSDDPPPTDPEILTHGYLVSATEGSRGIEITLRARGGQGPREQRRQVDSTTVVLVHEYLH